MVNASYPMFLLVQGLRYVLLNYWSASILVLRLAHFHEYNAIRIVESLKPY